MKGDCDRISCQRIGIFRSQEKLSLTDESFDVERLRLKVYLHPLSLVNGAEGTR